MLFMMQLSKCCTIATCHIGGNTKESIGGTLTVCIPGTDKGSGMVCGSQQANQGQVMFMPVTSWPRSHFRAACRSAVDSKVTNTYRQLDHLRGTRNMNKFWNLVRQSKCTSGSTESDISVDVLHKYYSEKFNYDNSDVTATVRQAEI